MILQHKPSEPDSCVLESIRSSNEILPLVWLKMMCMYPTLLCPRAVLKQCKSKNDICRNVRKRKSIFIWTNLWTPSTHLRVHNKHSFNLADFHASNRVPLQPRNDERGFFAISKIQLAHSHCRTLKKNRPKGLENRNVDFYHGWESSSAYH